jgi:hypothetical protein
MIDVQINNLKNEINKIGLRPIQIIRDHGWVEFKFQNLNCEEMVRLGNTIHSFFYEDGKYTHRLPKLVGRDGCVVLVISTNILED